MNPRKATPEGNTPLVPSANIGPALNIRLNFKLEMCNPSGSYKDRFVARQLREFSRSGVTSCIATSSGNTGSALAAYSVRFRIKSAIFVNEFAPTGKLRQMEAHGARVFRVRGFATMPDVTERVFQRLLKMGKEENTPLVVSAYRFCPTGMRGVEAIASELRRQSDTAINHVFVPVGGGGLFSAVCRGFSATKAASPLIHAVQPEGCATVVSAFNEGREEVSPVSSTTQISGLSVPFDIDASLALKELRKCGGRAIGVADEEVFDAQKRMIQEEGIWCEPAGAASLAGLLTAHAEGWVRNGDTVVCLVTGHGFKDPDSLNNIVHTNITPTIDENEVGAELLESSSAGSTYFK